MTAGRILIIGKSGQLATALSVLLIGHDAIALDRDDVDMADPNFTASLTQLTRSMSLGAIINAAAFTAVDQAEGEEREIAMRVNGTAVGELANWCKERDVPLVHFSSDYVFDGSGDVPRKENEKTMPVNAYGLSKRIGEEALAASGADYLLLRTSWVYDADGKNFFNTILRLLKEKQSLKIVADQFGAPTYAPHLAKASLLGLERALAMEKFPSGIYHLCAAGETSWHGFAESIFALARTRDSSVRCQRIDPIATSDYPLPAKRPLNSRLDCTKVKDVLGIAIPDWREGLTECMEEKYGRNGR